MRKQSLKLVKESGIPIPDKRSASLGGGRVTNFFKSLEVGDSFLVREGGYNSAFVAAKKIGIKIAGRQQPDKSVRIWRTA